MANLGKSIITDVAPVVQTPPPSQTKGVVWDLDNFEMLIHTQGYDAYIDRALRCPCVSKTTGQALSTCKNCLGRGWFFVDRRETRLISQTMKNQKRYENWSELNSGIAIITTRGSDKLGFMDRIILLEIEAYYSETLRPLVYKSELIAYPIYEPITIDSMFLFVADDQPLLPITSDFYTIDKNKIIFNQDIRSQVDFDDFNTLNPDISISVRYNYHPVYHVIDVNRELMKVRTKDCERTMEQLSQMPINVLAKKAHMIFNNQKFENELFDNTVRQ